SKVSLRTLAGPHIVGEPGVCTTRCSGADIEGIARAIGKQGELTGEMYKVSFPRSDLSVNVGNVVIKPALALMASFFQSLFMNCLHGVSYRRHHSIERQRSGGPFLEFEKCVC